MIANTHLNIFQRHTGGRRANVHTDTDVDLETVLMEMTQQTIRKKSPIWIPKPLNIKLRWTMLEINDKHVPKLDGDADNTDAKKLYLQWREVRWQ